MKKITLIIMMVLMISTVSALTGHIYHQTTNKDNLEIVVTYFNHGDYKIKDLKISAYMPDFYTQDSGFKIISKDSGRRIIYLETENLDKGYHPLIIRTMNDDGIRERKHSWVYIE